MCSSLAHCRFSCIFFFFNDTATTEIYTLSLHDALPIYEKYLEDAAGARDRDGRPALRPGGRDPEDTGVPRGREWRLTVHTPSPDPQQGEMSGLPRHRPQGASGGTCRDLDGARLRRGQAPPEPPDPHRGPDDPRRRGRPDDRDALDHRSADRRALGG